MMIVAGFGWAKPVPVDMRYFKHPKTGMAVTALGRPCLQSPVGLCGVTLRAALIGATTQVAEGLGTAIDFLAMTAVLSVGLGLFNLIPFPPLDGSKVVEGFLRTGSTTVSSATSGGGCFFLWRSCGPAFSARRWPLPEIGYWICW